MADAKISQLTPITGENLQDNDLFVVARPLSVENFSLTRAELFTDTPEITVGTISTTTIQAFDGTAAGSIAGTTGVVTLGSSVLTTTDINGGTIDGTVIGGTTPAAGNFTTGSFTGDVSFGDNDKAIFGAGSDLQIYHDGSNSVIQDSGTGDLELRGTNLKISSSTGPLNFLETSSVGLWAKLKYNNAEKLATTSTGIDVTGTVTMDGGSTSADFTFGDNDKAIFGAGSDLQIYHDGSNSIVADTGDGNLELRGTNLKVSSATGSLNFIETSSSNNWVKLKWNSEEKLATTSTGIDVTGTVTADGLTVGGVGLIRLDDTTVYSGNTVSVDQLSLQNLDTTTAYTPAVMDFTARGTTTTSSVWQIGNAGLNSAYAESDFFIKNRTAASTFAQRLLIDGNGDISFYEDTGTTPKFFWDASAEALGIGTTNLTNKFRVVDGTDATADFRTTDGADKEFKISVTSAASEVTIGTSTSHPLALMTGTTEAMRIDSSGNVLVGTSSSPSNGSGGVEVDPIGFIRTSRAGTTSKTHFVFDNDNGTVGTITTSGTATSYNTSSDYRLKEDIQPVSNASDRVLALKPVNFAWKADGTRVDGFLAHEAQEVVPEAVTGEKDAVDAEGNPEYQGIDQSKLVPVLTAALQEALQRIEALEAQLNP